MTSKFEGLPSRSIWFPSCDWAYDPENPNSITSESDDPGLCLMGEIILLEEMVEQGEVVNPDDVLAYTQILYGWMESLGF